MLCVLDWFGFIILYTLLRVNIETQVNRHVTLKSFLLLTLTLYWRHVHTTQELWHTRVSLK